jgi:hypothetical protein
MQWCAASIRLPSMQWSRSFTAALASADFGLANYSDLYWLIPYETAALLHLGEAPYGKAGYVRQITSHGAKSLPHTSQGIQSFSTRNNMPDASTGARVLTRHACGSALHCRAARTNHDGPRPTSLNSNFRPVFCPSTS